MHTKDCFCQNMEKCYIYVPKLTVLTILNRFPRLKKNKKNVNLCIFVKKCKRTLTFYVICF